ncbi:MAG TPA: hypothetical protein VMV71_00025, partial [Candidatus Paceibacterota bacterium]|nr:hypothetical protein [Candidatus Paceibacterota bacterium]
STQSDARDQILQALLGIVLLLGAFLILYTINPNLTNLAPVTLNSASGPGIGAGTGSSGSSGGWGTGGGVQGAGGTFGGGGASSCYGSNCYSENIAAAAFAYQGANTSGGPGNGTVACAWAVNNALTNAGVAPLDSTSVQSMENALVSGRGTLVDQSAAVAGDIVIQAQDGHVGICMNNGCTQVISNSSSKASFSWISDTSFAPSYSGGPGRIYQVNKG